jgi:hypothetical protein
MQYRGNLLIHQGPGSVILTLDWSHYFRVIPTDGRAGSGSTAKRWMGESRGRWEGDTLVVEVTNLNGKMWLDSVGNFFSKNVRLVERWRMVEMNTLEYEVTFDDPTVYTKPWKMVIPIRRNEPAPSSDPHAREFWEHACHEGNHDVGHINELGFKWFAGPARPD